MKHNPILYLILLATLAAALLPASATAESVYATRVEAAVADGDNSVVDYNYLYYIMGFDMIPSSCQADGGTHALGPSDLWDDYSESGASGWLNWSGSLTLGFDEYLKDGDGTDLTIYHIGYGSTESDTSETMVWVSADGVTWTQLGELTRSSLDSSNVSTSFDFADVGINGANYVFIEKYGTCAEDEDCYFFVDAVEGHHPGVANRPVVTLATGDPAKAPLEPVFEAAHWDPGSDYVHTCSQWQISTDSDFTSLVMDWTSETDLTSYTLPGYLLETETSYYCRVRFYDDTDSPSLWSDSLAFTTGSAATGEDTTVYAARVIEAQGGQSYSGDFYPVVVDQYNVWPTYEGDGGEHALGEPDYAQGGYASGWSYWGGHLILAFDTPVTNQSGTDLVVYHWGPGASDSDRSTAFAYASENGEDWVELGELSRSNRGIITTDAYDFSDVAGLDSVEYVKIVKNYNGSDVKKCGKYIDAVKGNPPLVQGQEVEDDGSLEGDWTDDDVAAGRVKFVNPFVNSELDTDAQIAVRIDPDRNADGTVISTVNSVDPASISDSSNRPESMPLGLVRFKVAVPAPGGEAEVTIHLPESMATDAKWYKYDTTNGWQDYTALDLAVFTEDRRAVVLQLKDGDYGDADLTENGIIVDPGGPGVWTSTGISTTLTGSDADTDAAGGCFIATAAFGSKSDRSVRILRRFRDTFLLTTAPGRTLVNLYYRFSPPLAAFIADHDSLRLAVRLLLLPVVAAGWLAIHAQTYGPVCLPVLTTIWLCLVFARRRGAGLKECR